MSVAKCQTDTVIP